MEQVSRVKIPEGNIPPVTTHQGFTVRELSKQEVEEIQNLPAHNQAFAVFDKRVIGWLFDDPCNTDNKRKLFNRSYNFCLDRLKEANKLVEDARQKELENLLNGVNGTTHPEG